MIFQIFGGLSTLGENIVSYTATATNKALPCQDGALPGFEATAEGTGTLAGAEVTIMATYSADMGADGTLHGECPSSGVVMAQDGVGTRVRHIQLGGLNPFRRISLFSSFSGIAIKP